MTNYAALHAQYRFTRQDEQTIDQTQKAVLDDSLFELIGQWAAENKLLVVGQALFERANQAPAPERGPSAQVRACAEYLRSLVTPEWQSTDDLWKALPRRQFGYQTCTAGLRYAVSQNWIEQREPARRGVKAYYRRPQS